MKRGLMVLGAALAYARVVRPMLLEWGATSLEQFVPLPGDDIVPEADVQATRAITVHAPASGVWPWVAQMGQGRAGLYTYDGLENLVGCRMHSADHIAPEWQSVAAGDSFRLHPNVVLEVAEVRPGRALVVRGGVRMGDTAPPYEFSWTFALREHPAGTTRLLVRERYGYTRRWAPLLVEPVHVVSFFMTQKMLRGIRNRAERSQELAVQAAV